MFKIISQMYSEIKAGFVSMSLEYKLKTILSGLLILIVMPPIVIIGASALWRMAFWAMAGYPIG